MVTIEIRLTEEQAWKLLDHARRSQKTVSAHVAEVDQKVAEWEWERRREAGKRFLELSGTFSSGLSDVSERHDDYYVETILEDVNQSRVAEEQRQNETEKNEQEHD